MHVRSVISAIIAAVLPLGVAAEQPSAFGTTILDGREIQLFSDFTWRFADTREAECRNLNTVIDFCSSVSGWVQVTSPNPGVLAQYYLNDHQYAFLVFEALGLVNGMQPETVGNAAILFAATAQGIDPSDVPVLQMTPGGMDGRAGQRLAYIVWDGEMPLVFLNTITVAEQWTLQAISYSVGETLDASAIAAHESFLAATRLTP